MALGKKSCPECKASVGCRVLKCVCGYDFFTSDGVPKKAPPGKFMFSTNGSVIIAASGPCPIPFQGDLEDWIIKLSRKASYSPTALKCFLRNIVSLQTEQEKLFDRIDAITGVSK